MWEELGQAGGGYQGRSEHWQMAPKRLTSGRCVLEVLTNLMDDKSAISLAYAWQSPLEKLRKSPLSLQSFDV